MLFLNRKEINYELYYKNTFMRIILNKVNYTNKYIFKKKPKIKLFFWFKKIKEENLISTKIFNHSLLLWLITGKIGKVKNLNSKLHRGIYYYRYLYYINVYKFYNFFNFLNEYFLMKKNLIKKHIKNQHKFLFSCFDLNMFTNLKLSNNIYLNSINEKLFIEITLKKINLNRYLNCFKL